MDTLDVLAAVLRGERGAPSELAARPPDAVAAEAARHGVLALLTDCLDRALGDDAAVRALAASLAARAIGEAAADLVRERELRQLLDAFSGAGIRTLIFKGAALAYSVYARPDLRPRADTDVLVRDEDRAKAHRVLTDLHYVLPPLVSGDLVMHQAIYTRRHADAPSHVVDLHWRIANPQVFAGLFTFDELDARAVALRRLSPSARGLSASDAVVIACVHRVAHHFDANDLIWLYDIHLLAATLGPADWQRVVDLAIEKRVTAVCAIGLARARERFGTAVPQALWQALSTAAGDRVEATAEFLRADRRQVDTFLSDVRALPRWTDRLKLVREHLFPPAQYMHDVYAPSSRAPLPVLYARRAFRGARKWLARA